KGATTRKPRRARPATPSATPGATRSPSPARRRKPPRAIARRAGSPGTTAGGSGFGSRERDRQRLSGLGGRRVQNPFQLLQIHRLGEVGVEPGLPAPPPVLPPARAGPRHHEPRRPGL